MLPKVITAVLLANIFVYVEGFERVIVVNESVVYGDDQVISHDQVVLAACCIYGNCSCPSLYTALANLISNVLINVTTDVILSSVIPLADLANITIIGHNNPTVSCNSSGGLHFVSCHNCIIEGISWKECGTKDFSDGNVDPVIQLYSSSNIIIRNCSFKDSAGQVVVLSAMVGSVRIDTCNFLSNKQYNGHGTAIFYTSESLNISSNSQLNFTITNCVFSYNEGDNSIVYFAQSSPTVFTPVYLHNSKFDHNKGVPIYLESQELYIVGDTSFFNNIAENGGGIVISDYSNVIFHTNATVSFENNAANNKGGAIFLTNHSSVIFKDCLKCRNDQCNQMEHIIVVFDNNRAKNGGAIYTENSCVIFGQCAEVNITSNYAEQNGGAVHSVCSSSYNF